VAAALLAMGGAVLVTKGLLTLGTDQFDTLEPWAGWLILAFAGIAAAAGVGAFRGHRSAGPLSFIATLGALAGDWIPSAPPHLLAVLPLTAATVLLLLQMPASVDGAVTGPAGQGPTGGWRSAVGWAGIALQVLVGFLYLMSGLMVPAPWVAVLWLLWAALFAVAVRVRGRRPVWTPLVALLSVVLWWAAISAGEMVLGWTA
jgi:hypothetical protein